MFFHGREQRQLAGFIITLFLAIALIIHQSRSLSSLAKLSAASLLLLSTVRKHGVVRASNKDRGSCPHGRGRAGDRCAPRPDILWPRQPLLAQCPALASPLPPLARTRQWRRRQAHQSALCQLLALRRTQRSGTALSWHSAIRT